DRDEPELERRAVGSFPGPVAVASRVTGAVEQLVRLVGIRVDLLVCRQLQLVRAQGGGQQPYPGLAVTGERDLHQLVAVDRVAERLPDRRLEQQTVALGGRRR